MDDRTLVANALAVLAASVENPPRPVDLEAVTKIVTEESLTRYSGAVLAEAIWSLRGGSMMPVVRVIENRCIAILESKKESITAARKAESEKTENQAEQVALAVVPDDPDQRKHWIASGRTRCDRLHRQWLAETKTGAPVDQRQRLRVLMDAYDKDSRD